MNKTEEERQYEIELLYVQALDDVITKYRKTGNIGYSHNVGGWICRELKKRGYLTVTDKREKYLFERAKTEMKKRLALIARGNDSNSFNRLIYACTATRNCENCEECETCKMLVNYRDMLVLYDWLKDNKFYEK
jgi:hypothetical protein